MSEALECRHGRFVFPDDKYFGEAMRLCGEYSELEVQFLCSLLKPGDVVVEAGAHVGTITVPLAKKVGEDGAVFAFEPQFEMHTMLAENVIANKLAGHVRFYELALGDANQIMRYAPFPLNTGGVSLVPDDGRTGLGVHVGRLDDIQLDGRLDLLKIDAEGMESAILRGAQKWLIDARPMVYAENDRPANTRELLDYLFRLSYRVWRFEAPLFNPDNYRGHVQDPWPGTWTFNVIAVPEEREPPEAVQGLTEIKRGQWAAVCRFGGVGDNLVAAAVLPGLVRQGNRVEMITSEHYGVVFEHNPWIDKLSICKDGDQPAGGGKEWQAWFEKRSHEYLGGLHHLSHSIETTLAFVEAQTQFWWPQDVRRRVCNVSYIDAAQMITGSGGGLGPLFFASAVERKRAAETKALMGPSVIGWVLCGSRLDKIYPQSAYAIARLIKELGLPVMMSGAPGPAFEAAKVIQAEVIKHNGTDAGLHLALSTSVEKPNWPIRRGLAQLLACDLVIGPDTGGMWAVALEQLPKIMLLSHASQRNITEHWVNTVSLHADPKRVPCWPCHRLHDSIATCVPNATMTGVACISDISVEQIVAAAKELLKGA